MSFMLCNVGTLSKFEFYRSFTFWRIYEKRYYDVHSPNNNWFWRLFDNYYCFHFYRINVLRQVKAKNAYGIKWNLV